MSSWSCQEAEELTCPLCLQLLQQAVQFPCSHGHFFCVGCLGEIMVTSEGPSLASQDVEYYAEKPSSSNASSISDDPLIPTMKCPVCREEVPLSRFNFNDRYLGLTPNLVVSNLAEEKRRLMSLCGECEKEKAQQYCMDCKASFCNSCCEKVHSMRMFRNHRLTEGARGLSTVFCSHHPKEELDMYCKEDEELVCQKCMWLPEHRNNETGRIHDAVGIEEAAKSIRENLEILGEQLQSNELSGVEGEAEQALEMVNESFNTSLRTLNGVFDRIENSVQIRRRELVEQLEISYQQSSLSLKNGLSMVRGAKRETEKCTESLKRLTEALENGEVNASSILRALSGKRTAVGLLDDDRGEKVSELSSCMARHEFCYDESIFELLKRVGNVNDSVQTPEMRFDPKDCDRREIDVSNDGKTVTRRSTGTFNVLEFAPFVGCRNDLRYERELEPPGRSVVFSERAVPSGTHTYRWRINELQRNASIALGVASKTQQIPFTVNNRNRVASKTKKIHLP